MNKQSKITLVTADDWCGLYIDGMLVHQAHSMDERMVLELLSAEIGLDCDIKNADEEWLNQEGNLPNSLNEVKFSR